MPRASLQATSAAAISPCCPAFHATSRIMVSTTTMSCTIRKPTAILPWSESIPRLSVRSFTMMIVLAKASATAT